jgi:hypothetical protein
MEDLEGVEEVQPPAVPVEEEVDIPEDTEDQHLAVRLSEEVVELITLVQTFHLVRTTVTATSPSLSWEEEAAASPRTSTSKETFTRQIRSRFPT